MQDNKELLSVLSLVGLGFLAGKIISQPSANIFNEKVKKRAKTLIKFGIKVPQGFSRLARNTLNGSIKCYLFDLRIPACIMAARAVEIILRKKYEEETNTHEKKVKFEDLINWANQQGLFKGLDDIQIRYIQRARNYMVHDIVSDLDSISVLNIISAAIKIIGKIEKQV